MRKKKVMVKAKKHTPITSKSEQGLFGAAYGAKKKGKGKPRYVPQSLWGESKETLKSHLKEAGGKKLPKKVKKRKKKS